MLFDKYTRTNLERADHDSSYYKFLNDSAWPSIEYIRCILENWYFSYPTNKDFISRFKSDDFQQHKSAFFELCIFHLFNILRFGIEIHPKIGNKSNKVPDFKIYDDSNSFYVECTHSSDPLEDLTSKRIKDKLCDVIVKIPSPKFFINIDFIETSKVQLSFKKFRNYLCKILKEEANKVLSIAGKINKRYFDDNGWKIEISLMPKSKDTNRSLGFTGYGQAQLIDSEKPFRIALNNKRASNYGEFKNPFIIAINVEDVTLSKSDICKFLYGEFYRDILNIQKNKFNESFFLNKLNLQNTRVSAIIISHGLVSFNIHNVNVQIWHNPWAEFPLSKDLLPLTQIYLSKLNENEYKINEVIGISLGELFKIDPEKMMIKNGS